MIITYNAAGQVVKEVSLGSLTASQVLSY